MLCFGLVVDGSRGNAKEVLYYVVSFPLVVMMVVVVMLFI